MNLYRVWYLDGTARLVDATDKDSAEKIAENSAREAGYYGSSIKVSAIEEINQSPLIDE